MIGLVSSPSAAAIEKLADCAERWRQKELKAEMDVDIPRCYADPVVKSSINSETSDKCAYCESRISATYFGDVEHILPKGARRDLALNYDNLTLACAKCNGAKWDYYDPDEPLLDPYRDDPADELHFDGPFLRHRLASSKAKLSILRLDLNRLPLVERRLDKWNTLVRLADAIQSETPGALRREMVSELERASEKTQEYSAMAAALLESVRLELEGQCPIDEGGT